MTGVLTEDLLRTVDINEGPDIPDHVLDQLETEGHARNGFCDSCWADADRRALSEPSKTQAQHYVDVLDEIREERTT